MRQARFLTATMVLVLLGAVIGGCAKPSETPTPSLTPTPTLSERLVAEIDFSLWLQGSLIASPNGQRVAYIARVDNKQFVVVDREEGRHKQLGDVPNENPFLRQHYSGMTQATNDTHREGPERLVLDKCLFGSSHS